MPRLFSGIEIPAAVARRLTLVRAGLNGARWIDPENYHVTLRFLGDVDGTTARDFAHSLGDIVASPFELRLNTLGSFGGNTTTGPGIAPAIVNALPTFTVPANYPGNTLGVPANVRAILPISDFAGFFVRWTWTLKAGEMLPVPISDLAGSFGFGFDGFSLI